ncbi:hypothetical protein SteCoe_3288 [Stentor coeruleus]|uniref:Uncharacterized protein n=1 Tax=Stentor coeruleus TaxID=5963 RepID=A0A1R2CXJ7_9CILI|nr:hypothetical protein SteCoe_3288 [Stentor coeruleus]
MQKSLNILAEAHAENAYFICPKKHKVFVVQNSCVVTCCQECLGKVNFDTSLHKNHEKNVMIMNLKNSMNKVYTSQNKQFELELFNKNIRLLKNIVECSIEKNPYSILYDKSAYFVISLEKYSSYYDYNKIFR